MKFSFNVIEFYNAASKVGGTIKSLAEKCGVNQTTLLKASRGEKISLRSYSRISKVLGIKFEGGLENGE